MVYRIFYLKGNVVVRCAWQGTEWKRRFGWHLVLPDSFFFWDTIVVTFFMSNWNWNFLEVSSRKKLYLLHSTFPSFIQIHPTSAGIRFRAWESQLPDCLFEHCAVKGFTKGLQRGATGSHICWADDRHWAVQLKEKQQIFPKVVIWLKTPSNLPMRWVVLYIP